jgi:hypothetical protein
MHLEAAAQGVLAVSYNGHGYIRSVDLRDDFGRLLFSWISNRGHLLFYIRRPALKVAPHLTAMAQRHHADLVTCNSERETKVRIEGAAEAERLASWLFAELPLPLPVSGRP